ncbi:MAG: redoxin domain-containing protein [Planctomycetota bacterium]
MRSLLKSLAPWALALSLGAADLQAQSETGPMATPRVQLSDAERTFDETVRAFEQHLYDAGAFSVDGTSDWTYSGDGRQSEGTNLYHVAVQKGGEYRIEAGSAERGKAQYICVSDGRQVIRLHKPANYYSQKPASATHDDLQHDSLTLQTLSGSGVELLIRPQMRAQLIARISDIHLVGKEMLDGREVTHMKLDLVDKRVMDVWFTTEKIPMLVQLATTEKIPINERKTVQLVTTSKFKWNVGGPLPAATFTVDIPPDARGVDNLLAALRDGDIRQLLGKPAPLLELNDTNGATRRLAEYRGKKVMVLIFWASWCAPSTNRMNSLNEFVAEAEKKGAVVWAINLGETLAQVKKCVKEYKYTGSVLLDPETKALDKYLFGQLPMTVLIGKDGTVQAFHSGSTEEARHRIRQDTATLLEGEKLVPVSQP